MSFEFSARTKEIIANFAAINPSLLFREGNTLKTISASKDIFAIANIVEVVPQEFAIYDLSRFLGALSLFDAPKLSFKEKEVIISGDGQKLKYVYASPTMIISAPDKEMTLPPTVAEFDITQKVMSDVSKALSALKLPEVVFASDGKNVVLQAADIKNPTGDSFFTKVGESDRAFKVILKAEKLQKLIAGDYRVVITHGDVKGTILGMMVFKTKDVAFYVAPEAESSFS